LNNQFMAKDSKPAWADLRLTDCIEPGVRLLLIGINPGVMSATTGHHFAGPTNRFWRLLHESGIVPEPVTHVDDVRLPAWGIGMTNLVARPTPGIDTLRPEEYLEGWKVLEKKIAHFRPEIVAFVGVTMYRALWKVIGQVPAGGAPALPKQSGGLASPKQSGGLASPKRERGGLASLKRERGGGGVVIAPGFQKATIHGARLFVLPNPSGRNAHFSYEDMLAAFRALARALRKLPPLERPPMRRAARAGR
jgi:TDG/mug DNA glycosylase family protein